VLPQSILISFFRTGVSAALAIMFLTCFPTQSSAQSTTTYNADYATVFPNPERGFHNRYELVTDPNVNVYVTSASPAGYSADEEDTTFSRAIANGDTLIHSYIHLDMWNTTATLPQEFLNSLSQGFANIRAAHLKTVVRFAYVWDSYPEVDISIIVGHIQQVGPILTANADIIDHLEAGFLGMWGEYHDCAYCDWFQEPEAIQRYQQIEALLRNTPSTIPIAIRYPLNYKEYVFPSTIDSNGNVTSTGVPDCVGALPDNCTLSQQEMDRLGFHDDCFLSDSADQGTYDNNSWMGWYDIPTKRSWMYDMLTSYGTYKEVGGETCDSSGNDTVSESQLEMSELHYTEINEDYAPVNVDFWQSTSVPAQGIDPAETLFTRFQRKLGYRFRLIDATFPAQANPSGSFTFSAHISNDAYGGLIHSRPVYLVFDNSTNRYNVQLAGLDPRTWLASSNSYSGSANTVTIPTQTVTLPAMASGTYRLSLWLPDASSNLQSLPNYAIRFANTGTWDSTTGLNVLASAITIGQCTSNCPPTAPTVVLGTVTSSSVALSWSGATDQVGVTGYYVFQGGSQIANVTGTSYTNSGLKAGTQYTYTVEAYDAAGRVSPASNAVTATTLCPSGNCTPPTPPTLTAGTVTTSTVALSWSGATDKVGVTGYYVFRGGAQIANVTGTSYTDTGLMSSTMYSYYVEAYDAAGNVSVASNTVGVTTTAPGGCHIQYILQSSWSTGFNGAVNITNTGTTAWTSWTLTWAWSGNQTLTQTNGATGSQNGPNVTMNSLSWDGSIAAGATLSGDVSFSANYSGTNNNPTTFYVNGILCQ